MEPCLANNAGGLGRTLRSLGVSLAACLLLLSCALPGLAQEPLHIVYPDFKPFFSRDAQGRMTGFFHDIVREALEERMGIRTTWEAQPWMRCQVSVRSGAADAMITVPTAERLAYAASHKHPFYVKTLNIFTYADNPKMEDILRIRTIDDIRRAGLTVITYSGNGWNDEHVRTRGVQVLETSTRTTVWGMLAHERGDLVIEWPRASWPEIRQQHLADRIVQTDIVLDAMPFHLLINLQSPYAARLDEFDAVIQTMREQGAIDRILAAYEAVAGP